MEQVFLLEVYLQQFDYWIEMVVLSELAVGGANKSKSYSLSEYLPRLKDISKELDIWFIPGSFYDHTDGFITN